LTNKPPHNSINQIIMKIPNNVTTGEMAVVLRAKSQSKSFTSEEQSWLIDAARMIEYLEKKIEAIEKNK